MTTGWDTEADRFDEEPDHGLRDAAVRAPRGRPCLRGRLPE
jgi:hypothetical protein